MQQRSLPWLNFILLPLFFTLAWLPARLSYFIGRSLGILVWHGSARNRRITLVNLALCFPELPEAQRQHIAKACFRHMGENLIDVCRLRYTPMSSIQKMTCAIEGKAIIDQALQSGKGVLLLSPHMGAWEQLSHFFLAHHVKLYALFHPINIKQIDDFILAMRARFQHICLPITRAGIHKIYAALKEANLVFILPDHEPEEQGGIYVPFFHQDAWVSTLPIKLVQKTQATVVWVCVERTGHGFKIRFSSPHPDVYSTDIQQATAALHRDVEHLIRQKPEQYVWNYKRFKRRPEGQSKIY